MVSIFTTLHPRNCRCFGSLWTTQETRAFRGEAPTGLTDPVGAGEVGAAGMFGSSAPANADSFAGTRAGAAVPGFSLDTIYGARAGTAAPRPSNESLFCLCYPGITPIAVLVHP